MWIWFQNFKYLGNINITSVVHILCCPQDSEGRPLAATRPPLGCLQRAEFCIQKFRMSNWSSLVTFSGCGALLVLDPLCPDLFSRSWGSPSHPKRNAFFGAWLARPICAVEAAECWDAITQLKKNFLAWLLTPKNILMWYVEPCLLGIG